MGKHDPVEERAFFLGPLGPGDVFGFGEAFFPRHYITVTATSAGELLVLPSADFHASLLAIPSANRYVLQALAWLARIHVFLLDWEGGEKRLRYWLYYRAWTDGETDGDRVLLPPATHEEIARVLNLSREFVSRTLSRLKERGVLRGTAGRIEVARDWFEERLDDPAYDPSLHRFFNIG